MTQPSLAPLPDLRELRTTFLQKQLAYALSYEYSLPCLRRGARGAGEVRLRLHAEPPERHPVNGIVFPVLGEVFHVLGGDRVPGLDSLGRDVPTRFKVHALDERVALRGSEVTGGYVQASAGTIEGRMILEAPAERADNEPLRISVTYDGTLQLGDVIYLENAEGGVPPETVRASTFVIPFFETAHPKYHWLTENACIAFGTWELTAGVVNASFDVYCAS